MQQASAKTDAAKRALSDLIARAKEQHVITGNVRVSAAAEAHVRAANGALDMIDVDPIMAILLMVRGHEQFEAFSNLSQEVALWSARAAR